MLVDHLQKAKKEYKSLKKQEIHDIFIKTNYIKLVFNMTKNVKNTVPWTYVISDLKCEEIVGRFYEKELQKNK